MVTITFFESCNPMIFPSPNGLPDNNSTNLEEDYADISEPRRRQALNRARNWFVMLVAGGLALGIVVAFGVVQLLNNLGLTAKPDAPLKIQIEREQGN
jgi:hypothetical protein